MSKKQGYLNDTYRLLQQRKFNIVKKKLMKLYQKSHNDYRVLTLLAYVYGEISDFKQAKEYYIKAFALNKKDYELHYNYGHLLFRKADYKQAEKHFKNVIKLNKTFEPAYFVLTDLYTKHYRNFYKAANCLENLLKMKPGNVPAMVYISYCCIQLNKINKAIKYLQKAIKKNKNHAYAYSQLAYCYELKRHIKKAIECYERAISLGCLKPWIFENLAKIYVNEKKYQMAIKLLRRALRKGFDNAKNNRLLGNCYEYLGKERTAASFYKKALKIETKKNN